MTSAEPDITVVVPCYNEASRWRDEYWKSMFAISGVRWLFADDASTDGTPDLVAAACELGCADALRLRRNSGKGEAVRAGIMSVLDAGDGGTGVGFMDADGAFSPSDVERLITVFRDRTSTVPIVDAVWSSRVALAGRDITRSLARHYIGRLVSTFASWGEPAYPYDTQSGFKLFRTTDALARALKAPFETRWLFELELLMRWRQVNDAPLAIWEEPLLSWSDVPGSKIGTREAVRVARELYLVKRRQLSIRRLHTEATSGP